MTETENFNFKNCWTCHEHKEGAFIGHWWSDSPDTQPHVRCVKCITDGWERNTEYMKTNTCLVCTNQMMDKAQFENFLKVISGKSKFTIEEIVKYLEHRELRSYDSRKLDDIVNLLYLTQRGVRRIQYHLENETEPDSAFLGDVRDQANIWLCGAMLIAVMMVGVFFMIWVLSFRSFDYDYDQETHVLSFKTSHAIKMTGPMEFFFSIGQVIEHLEKWKATWKHSTSSQKKNKK